MDRKPARTHAIAATLGCLAVCASPIGCGGATDGGSNITSSSSGGGSGSGSGSGVPGGGSGTAGSSPGGTSAGTSATPFSSSGSSGSGSSNGGSGASSHNFGAGSGNSYAGDAGDDATVEDGGIGVETDGAPLDSTSSEGNTLPDATSSDGDTLPDATSTPPPSTYGVVFNPMYSAFIPGSNHIFEVPALFVGAADSGTVVTWSASDPSAVGFESDPQSGGVLITVLAAGTFTIHAQTGSQVWSAPLTVTAFTDADWSAGNARYNDSLALSHPFADGGQSGSIVSPSSPSPFEPIDGGPGPACTNCHGPTATQGIFLGIQQTPEQTAGFSDQELIDMVVNGIIPKGWYYDAAIIPYLYWQWFHKWRDLTPEQERGIVVYLRSLAPVPQNVNVDFGGALAGP